MKKKIKGSLFTLILLVRLYFPILISTRNLKCLTRKMYKLWFYPKKSIVLVKFWHILGYSKNLFATILVVT